MNRLNLLASCVLAPLLVAAQDRPNSLLIVADDLGYADLGAYGSDIRFGIIPPEGI